MALQPLSPDRRALVRTSRRVSVGAAAATLLLRPFLSTAAAQDSDPLTVVASFSVLADIVKQVGGEFLEISTLVPVGGDAHTFDPSPDQLVAVTEADLIVEVGNDFEPWLNDLVESSGSSATRVAAFPSSEDPVHADEATPADDDSHAYHEDEGEDADHDTLHAWLDVHTTIDAVEHIADALAEIDPDNADVYRANVKSYVAELEELEAYIVDQTESLPENQRELITSHQTFGPFADAYGYEIVGVLLQSDSTEGADAPAGHVADLIGVIEDRGIPAVFPDTPGGDHMLQPVADGAGVEVAPRLYVDTLGEPGSEAETYIDMMRHNVDTIVSALRG